MLRRFLRHRIPSQRRNRLQAVRWSIAIAGLLFLAGCTTSHHRKAADKEAYGIIQQKQQAALGATNAFTIDTPYSSRKPEEIKADELLAQRSGGVRRKIDLTDALEIALKENRTYQSRKETVYLSALQLTRDRDEFKPRFFGSSSAQGTRDSAGERYGTIDNRVSASDVMKTGGRVGIAVANDFLRYFTGDPRPSAASRVSVDLFQPLLRGAGPAIAAESLTQSERNVVYEVRSFSQYQMQFAVDVVTAYFRLLQQKDAVRNEFNNYNNLVRARERAEALSRDRLPAFQVDQARQDELRAKIRYISTAENYTAAVDRLKLQLAVPLGEDLVLEDADLEDLRKLGLEDIQLTDTDAFAFAVKKRLDLLNEIDRFEDSKRRIKIAADALKADLNFIANASLDSDEDYNRFSIDKYRASAGLELNLPFWRLRERNSFRSSLVSFERQVRSLSQTFDDTKNELRQDLRAVQQARQNYDIQKLAVELADKRVDSVELLLQAGRAQIRDQLEANAAQVQARNSLTQALVDFHIARLNLLVDLGMLDTAPPKFWLAGQKLPATSDTAARRTRLDPDAVIPPDQLFGTEPRP